MNTHDIAQLCLCDEVLRLRSHELLLQRDQLRARRIFVLQFLDLVGDSHPLVARRLHGALRVPDLLEHAAVILQVLRKDVLLLTNLGQQHAEFVRDVGNRLIAGALAPFGQLRRDGDTLSTGSLVRADDEVFILDDFEQSLAQLGLLEAAQGSHGEAMATGSFLRVAIAPGPDRERSIPSAVSDNAAMTG